MGFSMRVIASVIALVLSGVAVADATTTLFQTSNGYGYTEQDARQAIAGYFRMASDHSFSEVTELVPSAEMPAWDKVAHYVGPKQLPNGELGYVVWLNDRYESALNNLSGVDPAIASQIIGAMLMAAMDGRLAGPKWKSFFDDATRRDLELAPQITDRSRNRHALVAKLAANRSDFEALRPSGVVGLSGNDLTSTIAYTPGLVGVAQVGIAIARITELMDDQQALAEPLSQQFIDTCFSHFAAMLPHEARASLAKQRRLLVVDASFDRVTNSKAFSRQMAALVSGLPRAQAEAFLVGSYAEQVNYNATVSRQEPLDTTFRSAIAQTAVLDDSLPTLAAMRQRLAALQTDDWADIKKQSAAMVHYILSAH
jgi:hypothetical protein